MTKDELRAWLLLMGFEVVGDTDGNRYVYTDDFGLRCRIDFAFFIAISWIPTHPLNTRPSSFSVTPKAVFEEIKVGLLRHDKK